MYDPEDDPDTEDVDLSPTEPLKDEPERIEEKGEPGGTNFA